MNLRPRQKQPFSGFTKAEVEKMELLSKESKEQSLDREFFKDLARIFNRSSNRAGKPCLKWTEVQSWFEKNKPNCLLNETSFDAAKKLPVNPEAKATDYLKMLKGEKGLDTSMYEFEARSKDGAWYDVDAILSYRFLSSGEMEVYVRYVGFGSDEDEWVNSKADVRVRSVAFEHSECHKVKAGDPIVCFQEQKDQARYYDAHIIDIERKLHDVRGCRCLFLIRYDHDNTQERVRLRRLCYRPKVLGRVDVS